ncbi:MAG: hypothetical protein GFH27_549323n28 [Chloroflexi bacterium AL-W]|nr:hypothetical protein [Chloroflexi bacterium AL-N1]NOK70179.1 hypothetical protein [Chloroflexi bacterium AL-N10]NOK77716.1 hypothetical protein [Chloroflexi bacterium AL-N5]NOK84725.1 hypothetical protein [Chloroflexi bacterium AL-W]NOK93212.1 hypothetical protein [Chloroflexi bacterium AL-N15]
MYCVLGMTTILINKTHFVGIDAVLISTTTDQLLRIGISRYNLQSPSSTNNGEDIEQDCCICGSTFKLNPISGVAADVHFVFAGNICSKCLKLSVDEIREVLRHTAADFRSRAARMTNEEQSVANRTIAEAEEREQWSEWEIVHAGGRAFAKARKTSNRWSWYPLLTNSTAVLYQAWFE